jgi:hypothetical protein
MTSSYFARCSSAFYLSFSSFSFYFAASLAFSSYSLASFSFCFAASLAAIFACSIDWAAYFACYY